MRYAVMLFAVMLSINAWAEETYVPSTPVPVEQVERWRLTRVTLDHGDEDMTGPLVRVKIVGLKADGTCAHESGQCITRIFTWSDATATALMTQLNIADLTTMSLTQRIWNKLASDGLLTGTIEGAP